MTVEHESSTRPRYLPAPTDNVTNDVLHNAVRAPDRPAFARRVDGEWRTVTWAQFADQVTALAAGIVAAGVAVGDRVAIMSGTSFDWVRADYAIWVAGGVSVPTYETSSATQVAWILRDSGAVAAFVADDRRRALVAQATSSVRHIWSMADGDLDVLAATARRDGTEQVEYRRRHLTSDTLATIVYTSGTTGNPKGCQLSHGNLLASVRDGDGGRHRGERAELRHLDPVVPSAGARSHADRAARGGARRRRHRAHRRHRGRGR